MCKPINISSLVKLPCGSNTIYIGYSKSGIDLATMLDPSE